jgi:hypothetical protein
MTAALKLVNISVKRFHALFVAPNIRDNILVNNNIFNVKLSPVVESGLIFTNEVLVHGTVYCNDDENVGELFACYLRDNKIAEFVTCIKWEFTDKTIK